ncbi:MAG: DHH family phosphoesterase [Desulfovibrio sp.]|uniref:DHH family phosphoesterase n=1 Tax=Desulfovibrio sp. TaxID=885 RepID=UPI0025861B2E|nr:DHH family phosphoesterase [Desulfovibrio sp.]MCD7984059.1 DHH family phosphoesterase [Desulfovibrio sp.]
MLLSALAAHERIAIQCHDAPDADALAAGFALHEFFSANGRIPYFFYGGKSPITKPNLQIMVEALGIPVRYDPGLPHWDGLLITVDCQYGSNNVQRVTADQVAVIDHHPRGKALPEQAVVRHQLGSCATLVWSLMREEGYVFGPDKRNLSIALYYGLYADTNGFSEARHPLDLNMRDALSYQDPQKLIQEEPVLKTLFTSNLSQGDLAVAFDALHKIHLDEACGFAVATAAPCDPNLLGYISDIAVQVATINTVVASTPHGEGFKFSVRTSGRLAKARDLTARMVADGRGSGGGHKDKAGGWVSMEAVRAVSPEGDPLAFFRHCLTEYLTAYAVIDETVPQQELRKGMSEYRKKPVTLGCVPSTALFPPATRVYLRMLEGETTIAAGEDVYFMVGLQGEAYFIKKEAFEKKYIPGNAPFRPDAPFEYAPTASAVTSGEQIPLLDHARECTSRPDTAPVFAKRLDEAVKVFPQWDDENYLIGEIGDWLVIQGDDSRDVYVVTASLFPRLYEPVRRG